MWLTLRTEARLAIVRWKTYSLVAVALALGLAIASTLVSLADSVIWRPVRVATADRLVAFEVESADGTTWTPANVSPAQVHQLQLQTPQHVEQLAGARSAGAATTELTASGVVTKVRFATVTPGFFPLFELPEVWNAAAATTGPENVVSHDLWERTLRPAGIGVGNTASIEAFDPTTFGTRARPLRIAGIAPRGFHFPGDTQLWLPATAAETHFSHFALLGLLAPGLNPGTVNDGAGADLNALRTIASGNIRARSLQDAVVPRESRVLVLLLGVTLGLLLTVWCQAALFTASETLSKKRAIDTRLALGASRARLVGELMVGPAMIAAAAFPLSTAIAAWLHRDIVAVLPFMAGRRADFGTTAILCGAIAAIVFLAAQAVLIDRVVAARMRRGAWRPAGPAALVPSRLAAVSAGISIVALYVSLLLAASFYRTLNHDYSFETDNLVAIQTSAMMAGLKSPDEQRGRLADIEAYAARLPGVTSVVRLNGLPFGTYDVAQDVRAHGPDADRALSAKIRETGPGLFDVLQVRLIAGRDFYHEEASGAPVAIVTQRVADALWPDGPALDARINIGDGSYRVVGIAADFTDRAARGLEPTVSPQVFIPAPKGSGLLVRTSGSATRRWRSMRFSGTPTRTRHTCA